MKNTRPLSIFVVENHPDTLRFLKFYLVQNGHQVETATSLKQAMEMIPQLHFDVLISDIGLPDGDGWELMRELHDHKNVFGIAMSGFGKEADRRQSLEAGFRHHMLKPFLPEELDALLATAASERDKLVQA